MERQGGSSRQRPKERSLVVLDLIQASSPAYAEVEEPYYIVEFTEAQRGRVTDPRL